MEEAEKECKNQRLRGRAVKCYHELVVAVVVCTRLAQDETSSMDSGGAHEVPPLAEVILTQLMAAVADSHFFL